MKIYYEPPKVMKSGTIYQHDDVKKVLWEILHEKTGFLLLAGMNGTGKSFAARLLYDLFLKNNPQSKGRDIAFYGTQADINFEFIKIHKEIGDAHNFLGVLRETGLFVIDDLGTRTPTAAFMDFIYSIMDYRYNNKLPTIITTNLNANELREKFGDAFVSRVASDKVFRVEGPDRRFKDF